MKFIIKSKIIIIRTIIKFSSFFIKHLPKSRYKEQIKIYFYKYQNSLPIELSAYQGETVVQIGTPRTRTVHRFLNAVGENGFVLILEAEPKNYSRLINHEPFKKHKNLKIINAAAWSETKDGFLQVSPSHIGDHKVEVPNITVDNDVRAGNEEMLQVPCKFYALDDLFDELKLTKINYLSVTVNGAELEVVKGAKSMLTRVKDCRLYIKGHCLDQQSKPLKESIANYLSSLGFNTIFTKGELSTSISKDWVYRAGDVYAWKD